MHGHDGSQFQNKIPVRIQGPRIGSKKGSSRETQMSHDEFMDSNLGNDIEFLSYVQKRTIRLYIGGFKPSITQEKRISYVESRGLVVTLVNIWISNKAGRVVIRLNVETTEGYFKLAEPKFWPNGVKCYPWMSKNRYNASRKPSAQVQRTHDRDNSYDGFSNGYNDNYFSY